MRQQLRWSMTTAAVLAGACTASASAQPKSSEPSGTTVTPVIVHALKADATIEVPSDNTAKGHWASAWPEAAYRDGINGKVLLSCDIDRYGLAEWCKVASESPPNAGFGAAALALRPTFKLKPAMGPDGPIAAAMTIAVEFKASQRDVGWGGDRGSGPMSASTGPLSNGGGADGPRFGGPGPTGRLTFMLNNPVWARTVGYSELAGAYPAKAGRVEGYVVAHCEVFHSGAVANCQIIKEDPEDRGFGKAALTLAAKFRVAPEWTTPPNRAHVWVDIPIRFPAPGAADARTVSNPYWVAGFDPGQALKVFPAEAADKGVSTGLGVAECLVAVDGSLNRCVPKAADPEGLGFSEAAVVLASTMRMNPWLRSGEPVDGAVIRLHVRLNLQSSNAPPGK